MDIFFSAVMFTITYPLAVLLCLAAHMVIGMLWFGPIFQKPWVRLSGMSKFSKKEMTSSMAPAMTASIASGLVQASVIGTVLTSVPVSSLASLAGLITLLWLGFTFTVMGTSYAYTKKSFALLLIDTGYPLVSFVVMGIILHMRVG